MTKHIIKYSNRKFYDKSIHKYINLPEILSFVKDGGNIQIMDYDTKEDLTSITLFALKLKNLLEIIKLTFS